MSMLEVAGFICKFGGGLNLKSKLKSFFVTKMSSYIYAVISCISFTTLCYAMLFNLNDKL